MAWFKASSFAIAMLDDHAPKPARKRGGLPERGKVKVSCDKGFLSGILSKAGIAQHRIGDPVSHILAAFHDLRKCFFVATLCCCDPITELSY
jgi:hypothetical protein